MYESHFLGQPYSYWIELKERVDKDPATLGHERLLKEVIELRGKVDFYQSRIKEMAATISE